MQLQTMVSGVAAIIRFLGIMLSSVHNVINAKCIINGYFDELVDDNYHYTSCFVRELLLLRDNASVSSSDVVFFR